MGRILFSRYLHKLVIVMANNNYITGRINNPTFLLIRPLLLFYVKC